MGKYNETVKLCRGWRERTEADIYRRLCNFRMLFAYNSCRIENEADTMSETR
jgi:hypothetical protein